MKRQGKIKIRKRPPARIILSTFASVVQAKRIGRGLVGRQLAACCNVIPALASFFVWKGRTEEAREALLLVKTSVSRLPQALDYVKRHHPYELPELLVLSLEAAEASYLKWIMESCKER